MADIVINPAVGKIDFFSVKGDNVTNTLKLSGNTLLVTGPLSASSISTGGGGAFVTSVQPTSNFLSKFTGNSTIANSLIYDNGTNVGIGTTSPIFKFQVVGSAYVNNGTLYIDSGNSLTWGNSTQSILGTNNVGLSFTAGSATRMFISSSGNIGIGTTTTAARLHVNTTTAGSTVVRADGTSGTLFSVVDDLTDSLMSVNNSAGLPVFEVFADDRIVGGQYGVNDFVITNNRVGIGTSNPLAELHVTSSTSLPSAAFLGGNVGVGTTSPIYPLDIPAAAALTRVGSALIGSWPTTTSLGMFGNSTLDQTNAANYALLQSNQGITYLNAASGQSLRLRIANTDRLIIDSGGNVGIGTTSFVYGSANRGLVELYGSSESLIALRNSTGNLYIQKTSSDVYINNTNSGVMSFATNNTQRMVILAGGSVSFGSSADILAQPGNIYLNGNTGTANGPALAFGQSDSVTGGIGHLARITGGGTSQDIFIQSQGASNSIGLNANPSGAAIYFQTQGAEKVRITAAGNVGIGTSTPATKLDIYGPVSVRGTTVLTTNFDLNAGNAADIYGNIRVLRGASLNDGMYIGYGGAGGNLKFFSNSGTTEFMTIATTGNVGIGSTSPAAKLDIAGTNSTIALSFGTTVPNNPLFINTYGSNTGIGMDQATAGLRLVGDYSGASQPLVDIGYYSGGSVSHANWVSRFKVVNSGATNFTANVYHSIGGQKFFGGSGGTNSYIYTGTTSFSFINSSDSSTLMTILNSGSVGIGTTSPLSKLDVRGNLYVNYGVNGTGYVQTNGSDSDLQITTATNLTTLMNTGGSAGLAFGAGNSERMRITSGGNLGIGTTSGTFTLNVYNNADVWHARFGSAAGELRIGGQTSSGAVIQSFVPGSSTVRDLYIQRDGGNVGIGTTTTSYKLTINGDLAFNGGLSTRMLVSYTNLTNGEDWANSPISIRERDQVGNTQLADKYAPNLNFHWANRASKSVWMDANGILNWGEYDASGIPAADGTFKTAILLATSNVGIGTTSPTQRLEVAGIAMAGQGAYRTSIYGDNGGAYLYFGTTANTSVLGTIGAYGGVFNINSLNGDTLFLYNGSEKMRITTGGNVGIGTSSPSIKLAVDGEASFGDGSKLTLIGLDINSQVTPNFIKIRTKIPFASGAADFTINIKGFRYGGVESTSLMICWHYYLSTFYNPTISSAGSYAPTVKLSAEDWDSSGTPKVCIVLVGPGYWPKLYVESMYSSNYNDAYADGWDWVDADATGTGNNLAILSYKSNFGNSFVMTSGGNVGIGTTSPGTSLEVYAVPATSTTLRQMLIINTDFASATGTGFGGSIVFRGRTAGNLLRDNAQITAYNEDIGDNGYALGFFTRPNDTLGMVQRLTIVRGGNVGIGTSSPTATLQVGTNSSGTASGDNSVIARIGGSNAAGRVYNLTLANTATATVSNESAMSFIVAGNYSATGIISAVLRSTVNAATDLVFTNYNGSLQERMRILHDGNVGIGTTSPSTKLHIYENANRVTYISQNDNHTARFEAYGTATAIDTTASNGIFFRINSGDIVKFAADGNVGIGTSTATAPLHIYRASNPWIRLNGGGSFGYIRLDDGTSNGYLFKNTSSDTSNGALAGAMYTYTDSGKAFQHIHSGTPLFTILSGGNVGIGTTSPLTLLDVRGGSITAGSSASTNGSTILAGYYTSGTLTVLGTEYSSGGPVLGYAVSPSTSATGAFLSSTTITIPRSAYVQDGGTHRWYTGASQTVAIGSAVSTSERMRMDISGQIGIGTSTPRQILHLNGSILLDGIQNGYEQGSTRGIGYGSNSGAVNTDGFSGMDIQSVNAPAPNGGNYSQNVRFWTHHYGTGTGNTPRMVLQYNGFVGIGTTSPVAKLHVVSDAEAALFKGTATFGSAIQIEASYTGGRIYQLQSSANGAGEGGGKLLFVDKTAAATRLTIDSGGNVGIGTTSPTSKLHVVETNATGSRIQLGTSSTNALMNTNRVNDFLILTAPFNAVPASTSNNNAKWGIKMNGGSTDSPNVSEKSACIYAVSEEDIGAGGSGAGYNRKVGLALHTSPFDLPNVERVRINNLGNVGIGTTNPATLLHVDTSGADARIRVSAGTNTVQGGMIANTNGLVYAGSITNHGFSLRTNDTDRVRIQTDGNVGIGTTSPSNKLEVGNFLDAVTNKIIVSARYEYQPEFNFRLGQSGTNLDWIGGVISCGDDGNYNGVINFKTANAGRDTPTTKMVIKASGNVGIGLTTPSALLNIRASAPTGTGTVTTGTNILLDSNTSNYITFRNTSDNGTYAGLTFLDNNTGGYVVFRNYTAEGVTAGSDCMIYGSYQDHIFQNSASETINGKTETMRIKSSGYVGINTNNPTARLQVVQGNSGGVAAILLSSDESTIQGPSANTQIRMGSNLVLSAANISTISTNGSERVRIQSDGNVGIGTTSPTKLLHLYANNDYASVRLQNTAASKVWDLTPAIPGIANSGFSIYNLTDTSVPFHITNSGNVGIGTTTPLAQLHVNSTTAGATLLRTDGTSGTLFSVVDDLTDSLMSVNNSAGLPVLEVFADDRIVGGQYGANDFVITNNRVGIGTSNPLAELHVTGSATTPAALFFGNVGIGTTSFLYPTANRGLLEIYGSVDSIIALKHASTHAYFHKASNDFYLVNGGAGTISIYNNGSERMQINSSGNVGIGTTTVPSPLTIYNNADVWHFRLGSASGELRMGGQTNNGAVIQAYTPAGVVRDLYIQRDGGKLGIGTNSPNSPLTIVGDGTQNNVSGVLRVADTGSSKWGSIGLPDVQSTTTAANNFYLIGRGGAFTDRVLSIHIPNATDYGSGAQPKFGVYSTGADLLASVEASTGTSYFKGNVGIGSASPTQKLDVNGSIYTSGKLVQRSATQSLSGTTGCTIDLANGAVHILSLANATTISSFTYNNRDNNPSVNTIMLVVKYAGTASITFTNVIWANGATPTLTGTNGYADVFMLTSYQGGAGTPVWIGTVVAQALVSTNL